MTSVPNYTELKQGYVYSLFLEQKYRNRQQERETHREEWRGKKNKRRERKTFRNEKQNKNEKKTARRQRVRGKSRETERR